MGLFSRMRVWKPRAKAATNASDAGEAGPCTHGAISPRWDNVQDMGIDDRATSFVCMSCREVFDRDEGLRLRAVEADRVRGLLAADEGGESA